MKVVINDCYGGFTVSYAGMMRYCELKGIEVWPEEGRWGVMTYWLVPADERVESGDKFYEWPMAKRIEYNNKYSEQTISNRDFDRADPILVQVVEELEMDSFGDHASLKVIEIPDDIKWHVAEYDGNEWIAEDHRTWS